MYDKRTTGDKILSSIMAIICTILHFSVFISPLNNVWPHFDILHLWVTPCKCTLNKKDAAVTPLGVLIVLYLYSIPQGTQILMPHNTVLTPCGC